MFPDPRNSLVGEEKSVTVSFYLRFTTIELVYSSGYQMASWHKTEIDLTSFSKRNDRKSPSKHLDITWGNQGTRLPKRALQVRKVGMKSFVFC